MSGGKQISGQLSGVLWLKEPVESCISSLNCSPAELKMIARKTLLKMAGVGNPVGIAVTAVNELYKRTKAAGSFAGINLETQLVGVGADVFGFRVRE